jgi:hypothetical protein
MSMTKQTACNDRRKMNEYQQVQLWLRVHELRDELRLTEKTKKIVRMIAFRLDISEDAVYRLLNMKLRTR